MAQVSVEEIGACYPLKLVNATFGLRDCVSDPTAWNPRPNWGPFREARRYSTVTDCGCDLASATLFELELSELLVGSQTCGQAFVSPEGRRAKGKRTFRVPSGPGARSAQEDFSQLQIVNGTCR